LVVVVTLKFFFANREEYNSRPVETEHWIGKNGASDSKWQQIRARTDVSPASNKNENPFRVGANSHDGTATMPVNVLSFNTEAAKPPPPVGVARGKYGLRRSILYRSIERRDREYFCWRIALARIISSHNWEDGIFRFVLLKSDSPSS